jgi:magnesium transporter
MSSFGKRFSQPGSAPGTLVAREGSARDVQIRVIRYSGEDFEEQDVDSVDEVLPYIDMSGVVWIDVCGLSDIPTLEKLGEKLGLHSLALEDVLHAGQRPKVDMYEDHAFVVLKQAHLRSGNLGFEQVSVFFGKNYVLTLQGSPLDDWEPVRQRIRSGRVRIRKAGADYLAYALVDAVIDSFFPLLEEFGDRIEDLQQALLDQPNQEALERIHAINRELILIRRAAWPHREVANTLERSESELVKKGTRVFLRDCYDHTVQTLDILESYRDLARGLMDLYLSTVSNRMNEVMKVLTVMASIFIPLTFLAGIYGMNFDPDASPLNMPELRWAWGYPAFWLVIIVLGAGMVAIFKRRNWW